MTQAVTIGISLKTYFSHARADVWLAGVAERIGEHPAVTCGTVRAFVIPTYLQIPVALDRLAGTPVLVGAQDVSAHGAGAYTGEVTAAELAEIGVAMCEIGHAERRRLFAETDEDVAAKAAMALAHGLEPVLCVGEGRPLDAEQAAEVVLAQLRADLDGAPAGAVTVAYEPVWAIGAEIPAPAEHVVTVAAMLREALDSAPDRRGSRVLYGGSAGPGLLTRLGDAVDGLFVGRFGHELDALVDIVDEASSLARGRAARSTSSDRLT